MQNKIIALVLIGMSCSGKDTVLQKCIELSKSSEEYYNLEKVVSYTTRPMREGEVHGQDYWFVTDEELEKMDLEGKLFTVNNYNTKFGIWSYGLAIDSFTYNENYKIHITNAEEFEELKECEELKVISVYLDVADEILINRATNDKRRNNEEYKRRFYDDYLKYIKARENVDYIVDCNFKTPEEIAHKILEIFNIILSRGPE